MELVDFHQRPASKSVSSLTTSTHCCKLLEVSLQLGPGEFWLTRLFSWSWNDEEPQRRELLVTQTHLPRIHISNYSKDLGNKSTMWRKWRLVPEDDHTPAHKFPVSHKTFLLGTYSSMFWEHHEPINLKSFKCPSFYFSLTWIAVIGMSQKCNYLGHSSTIQQKTQMRTHKTSNHLKKATPTEQRTRAC